MAAQKNAPKLRSAPVNLELHSTTAQAMIEGGTTATGQNAIIGLKGFAAKLRLLRSDDERLATIDDMVKSETQTLNLAIEQHQRRFTAPIARLESPVKFPMRFSMPLAYKGGYLLQAMDTLICLLLSAEHHGQIDKSDRDARMATAVRLVRKVFLAGYQRGEL